MTCYILLQTGGRIIKQAGNGFLLLNNCVVDDEVTPGYHHYHPGYYENFDRKSAEKEIVKAETNIIDLKQREQELRLRQLAVQKAKDKREAERIAASIKFIQEQIELESRALLAMQNNLALVVLMMACPFLKIGGVQT